MTATLTAPATRSSGGVRREPRTPAGGAGRLAWIDSARGFIMLTVVILHVGIYQFLPVLAGHGGAYGFWTTVNGILGAIRMPALLVISGWLAATTVLDPAAGGRARTRIVANGYLFVLWMTIYAVLTWALGAQDAAQAVPFSSLLRQLLLPDSTLWFLAALVWYTLALRALRRVPAWAVVAGLLVIGALSSTYLPIAWGLWVKIPEFAVFFALGVYGKRAWGWVAEHPLFSLPLAAFGTYAGIEWENYQTLVTHEWSYPSAFVLSVAMAALLFALAGLVSRYAGPVAKPFALIGRNTAPVYVLHYPALLVMTYLPAFRIVLDAAVASEPIRWIYPVAMAALITAAAIGIKHLADVVGMRWLFAPPQGLTAPRIALRRPLSGSSVTASLAPATLAPAQAAGLR